MVLYRTGTTAFGMERLGGGGVEHKGIDVNKR